MRRKMAKSLIGILGAGAWGTALAQVCALANNHVLIWAHEKEVVDEINSQNSNSLFLPNITLNREIKSTNSLEDLAKCDAILAVIPAQFMRKSLVSLGKHIAPKTPIILCSKGIEQQSLEMMTQVLHQSIPQAICGVLSGPSFAKDVAIGLPTAVTLACEDKEVGEKLLTLIGIPTFRPYLSEDLIGAEIGGAVKNVLAIACGMAEGRGLGESARAALITRGFAEMVRLGVKMGANANSLNGLCGLGDLVLTCSSKSSRNFSLGFALGQGQSFEQALSGKLSVAEGAATAPALMQLANKFEVEMPICQAVATILSGQIAVSDAINSLLSRPFKGELA
jgi:glycerol-3-phosphate dehydrogenase (NAD(P)+)